MRRSLLVLAAVIALAGCVPGLDGNNGWPQARTPNRAPVTIGDVPTVANDFTVTGPWMALAGWAIFAPPPAGQQPQIRFSVLSPMCRYGRTDPCQRVEAWVQRFTNPDGSLREVVIHYDPQLADRLTVPMWQHEVGHALGFAGDTWCDNPYRGVMSYCGWYEQLGWFGDQDVQMVTNVGYR